MAGLLEKCEGPQRTATNVYEKPRILVRSKAACPQRRTALGLPNILASRKGADMQTMYQKMDDAELASALADLKAQVAEVKARGLKLDMARGKPSPEQVDISRPMLDLLSSSADLTDHRRGLLQLRLL